ncbi:MAG: O-antigen ligase family protein [Gemmatimonadota bacterium]|nr:O-antigen ligase family protein [Gemmatimonadota bacterium]
MRPSYLTRIVFPLFAWGLAFHSLAMAVLFGWFALPVGVVRVIAAWKDIGLLVLLLIVFTRAITGRGPRVQIAWTDFWIGALVVLAMMYFAGENLWLRTNLPISAELLGLRQAVFFMLVYFVGRAMPDLADDDRTMRRIFTLVLFTCVAGILERFLLPPEGLVALGVAAYFQDFLGATAITVGNEYGLPTNYWASVGGHQIRRAGSIYLGGQGFAIPFLLFFPMLTAWVFSRQKRSKWQVVGYSIVCLALLLTLTRMTIIVAMLQLLLFILLRRRPEWAVAGLALVAMVFLSAMVLLPGFPTFVLNTLSGQESSTAGHLTDWQNGMLSFLQQPWGFGLGTADLVAARSGLEHITGDNLYLTYAVEMGLAGVVLLALSLGSIMGHSLNLLRNADTEAKRRMGTTLWLAAIGLSINGMTAVVFNSITLGWLFFWLAGAVVTQSQRARSSEPAIPELRLAPG